MKKNLLLSGKKICLFVFLLLGMGSALFGAEQLFYGDKVYIQNLKIKKYATRDGNVLVGHKTPSDKSIFVIIRDIENPELGKGEPVSYGDDLYLQTSPAAVVGDSGEEYRIYGMMRKLLGAVSITQKDKLHNFTILSSVGKKGGQPVYYGEKINLQYAVSSKSPIKYFRFNVDVSTYKKGTEVFGSDDSSAMTTLAKKSTKELAFEKIKEAGKGGAIPPTDRTEIKIGKKLNTMSIKTLGEKEDPITKEEFKVGDKVVKFYCGHIFLLGVENGIEDWFKKDQTCPICRAEGVNKNYMVYKLVE